MSLARAWRRQLLGASTAALIVPSAMLAALVALALSGAFSQVGVLGQLFVGPSLPVAGAGSGAGGGSGSGAAANGFATASLPVIPDSGSDSVSRAGGGVVQQAPAAHPVLTANRGTGVAGGAIGGTGGTVTWDAGGSGGGSTGSGGGSGGSAGSGGPGGSGGSGSSPGTGSSSPAPAPPPQHNPTPVDTAVTVVTSVTQQVPAPVGPVATQTVRAVGSAVDNLLPQTGQP